MRRLIHKEYKIEGNGLTKIQAQLIPCIVYYMRKVIQFNMDWLSIGLSSGLYHMTSALSLRDLVPLSTR